MLLKFSDSVFQINKRPNTAWTELDHRLIIAWTELDNSLNTAWTELDHRLNTAWTELDHRPNIARTELDHTQHSMDGTCRLCAPRPVVLISSNKRRCVSRLNAEMTRERLARRTCVCCDSYSHISGLLLTFGLVTEVMQ